MSSHWPPRKGDRLYDADRMHDKVYPEGTIVGIDKDYANEDDSEVHVCFVTPRTLERSGRWVLVLNDNIHWDARHSSFKVKSAYYLFVGEENSFPERTDYSSYTFAQLEGNWSSNDGGLGRWEIG